MTTDVQITDAFSRTEPRALINLVPTAVAAAFVEAHQASPDLFGQDERDLFLELRRTKRLPSPTDNRMRIAFWMEYDRAQARGSDMNMEMVYGGICSRPFFYQYYLKAAYRIAWLMTPPVEYEKKLLEGLDFGLDLLRSYLEIDANPEGGKPNIKLMELQAKIVSMFDQRMKGGYTQRAETKSLNLQVNTTDKAVAGAIADLSMEQMEKRMQLLEEREKRSQHLAIDDQGR
jgi:hypothetical protein